MTSATKIAPGTGLRCTAPGIPADAQPCCIHLDLSVSRVYAVGLSKALRANLTGTKLDGAVLTAIYAALYARAAKGTPLPSSIKIKGLPRVYLYQQGPAALRCYRRLCAKAATPLVRAKALAALYPG